FPSCRLAVVAGSSSYQRSTERPPGPSIVCCVQTASAPLASGSACATACVSRVSDESSTSLVPGCGTGAGMLKLDTVMLPLATRTPDKSTCQAMIVLPGGSPAATT